MCQLLLAGVLLLFGSLQIEGALLINGTDCIGYTRTVNATLREVDCPPAVDTVQLPVVEAVWEILISEVQTEICHKVTLYRNQSVLYQGTLIASAGQLIYTELLVNKSMSVDECDRRHKEAYNTTRSSPCCLDNFHSILSVNKDKGSLVINERAGFTVVQDKSATCSVTGSKGQTASSSFTITIQSEKREVQVQYPKASPALPADSNTPLSWRLNVGSSNILCMTAEGPRWMRSQWSYKGLDLDIIEVPIATENCTDCRREECIREAERMAGLTANHPPVAIVGRWETPCFGPDPPTNTFMSFVRVANATLEDSGDYIVQFQQAVTEFSQVYHVTVDWLRETSFVEEPSRELTVPEGHSLHVPCVISTAVDANLSQIYWSGPQGLISGISSLETTSRPEMVCEQNHVDVGRVFYVQMNTQLHSDAGTLAQVSIELHICNAEQQDSGVYRCGVWTGESNRNVRGVSLTVESTTDEFALTLALSVVGFALFVILGVLIALLGWCVCERYQRVQQHCLYRMHLQPMPSTKSCDVTSPTSLIPPGQTIV